jgi:TATA-binding protein-associated factor Taf7
MRPSVTGGEEEEKEQKQEQEKEQKQEQEKEQEKEQDQDTALVSGFLHPFEIFCQAFRGRHG